MPKVPQRQDAAIADARVQIPNARVNISEDVVGGGRVLQGLTQAQRIFAEEKKRADDVAALEAGSKLSEIESNLLMDPETGALNQHGKNAFAVTETVNNNFDKQVAEIESGLTTIEQKESFRRAVLARKSNINNKLRGHVARERVKFDNKVTDSFIKNEATAAVLNWNDQNRVSQSVALQQAAIEDHGERNGLPKEAIELRKLEVSSKTHANVVSKMLAENETDIAKDYFKNNKKQFTAT